MEKFGACAQFAPLFVSKRCMMIKGNHVVVLVPFAVVDEVVRQERPLNFQRRRLTSLPLSPWIT